MPRKAKKHRAPTKQPQRRRARTPAPPTTQPHSSHVLNDVREVAQYLLDHGNLLRVRVRVGDVEVEYQRHANDAVLAQQHKQAIALARDIHIQHDAIRDLEVEWDNALTHIQECQRLLSVAPSVPTRAPLGHDDNIVIPDTSITELSTPTAQA